MVPQTCRTRSTRVKVSVMIYNAINITSFINGGWGLAKLDDGRRLMVRYVLPGEIVAARQIKDKGSYVIADLHRLESEAAGRVRPLCPLYGICGGCDLQHASYPLQLTLKQQIITELVSRQCGLGENIAKLVAPVVASPDIREYRQRIRLHVCQGQLGYLGSRQHYDFVAVTCCPIAKREINELLDELGHTQFAARLFEHCSMVELSWNPATGKVTMLCSMSRKPRPADRNTAAQLVASCEMLERIFAKGDNFSQTPLAPKDNDAVLSFEISGHTPLPLHLSWEVGGFCQVNLRQNETMVRLVKQLAAVTPKDDLLDLFCGMGNFSLPLAAEARSLLGVEGQGSAVRSAQRNLDQTTFSKISFVKNPIHEFCRQLVAESQIFDTIILDPPRQGVPGLASELAQLCRQKMIYISCDPATLCRDLAALCKTGFTIKRIIPIDMFPQTHHVETVVLMEK